MCQRSHAAIRKKKKSIDPVWSFLILLTSYHSLFSFPCHSVFQLWTVRLSTKRTRKQEYTNTADLPWALRTQREAHIPRQALPAARTKQSAEIQTLLDD